MTKRAARRRRKRRAAAGTAALDRSDRGPAPAPADRAPAKPAAPPEGDRPKGKKNRRRRSDRKGDASLRGLRQAQAAGAPEEGGRGGASGGKHQGRSPQPPSRTPAGRPETGRGHGGPAGPAHRPNDDHHRRPHDDHHRPAAQAAPHREGRHPRALSGAPLYAALDLGTNNCRLLVAEPQERGFRVVDAFSRIVRLGEGIGRSGRLGDAAMDRAVEALAVCRTKMDELSVRRMRLVATEACRSADNGAAFLARVRSETGLTLEIVDRETEARLAVAGCATLVDPQAEGVVLFDIGGGSSELVWLDLRDRGHARGFALTRFIKAWTSLPVGVVTLSERHGGVLVTRAVFEEMVAEVDEMIGGFDAGGELSALVASGRVHMLGTSGTVTTLAGIHLGLKRYDRRRVDGVWLERPDVDQMVDRLVAMDYDERVANPCIGADRADLVLAGCAILEAIRRRWPCDRLRVADRGLREGILVELMARDGVWRRRGPQRPRA